MEGLISQDLSALVFHWETRYIPSQGTFSSFRAMWCKYNCSIGLSRIISSKREISQVAWFVCFVLYVCLVGSLIQYCFFRKNIRE